MARRRSNQQPTRVPTGGPLGQRQQLEQAQNTIPLPRSGGVSTPPPPAPGGPPTPGSAAAPVAPPNVFGPTGRPDEPVTAGAPVGPGPNGGMLPDDPVQFLRAIAMQYPSAGIQRLLERASRSRL